MSNGIEEIFGSCWQVNGTQIVLYLYTEITLSKKMDLTIDTCDSTDDAHSNYVEIKKESKIQKRINTARFNFYKVLENANYSSVTIILPLLMVVIGRGQGRRGTKETKSQRKFWDWWMCLLWWLWL